MITDQETATLHANHRVQMAKHKNVVVLPDGQIYTGEDAPVQKIIDLSKTVFIVKGDLKKEKKKSDAKTE